MARETKFTKSLKQDANSTNVVNLNRIQAADATGSPITSPKAGLDTTGVDLVCPANAITLVLKGAAAIRITDVGADIATRYYEAKADEVVRVPVADMDSVRVAAATGTTTLQFYFELL